MKKNSKEQQYHIIGLSLTIVLALVLMVLGLATFNKQKELAYEQMLTPVPSDAPPTIFARPTEPLLRVGSISPEVKHLQKRLGELGYYQGEIDGQYGKGTGESVRVFQEQNQLQPDGMAGADTLALLYSDRAKVFTAGSLPSPSPTPGV